MKKGLPILICAALCILFGAVLLLYTLPMEDMTLDLTTYSTGEAASQLVSDNKGWTVYTQEGDTVTLLENNGRGHFLGIGLGQTLYLSRVLEEDLDNPTLQIGTAERTFIVWLDDEVIYTDWPELDPIPGQLRLPMNYAGRSEPVCITLPMNYRGKTLTIAQSTPEQSETPTVMATPASIKLYCGYAYESGIVSETYTIAISAAALFAAGVALLIAFLRRNDWSLLCIALIAFSGMCIVLWGASFRFRYLGISFDFYWYLRWLASLALVAYLALRAGTRGKKLMQALAIACAAVTPVSIVCFLYYRHTILYWPTFFFNVLPWSLFLVSVLAALLLGMVYWRRENRFFRLFAPLTLVCLVVYWAAILLLQERAAASLALELASGSVYMLYLGFYRVTMVTALVCALWDELKTELELRMEKWLVAERREMALASFENLRRQHEEVMMLRHDMLRHFRTLHDMGGDEKRTSYLAELIGQNQKIRLVVETGNETLDIILNSKLSAAADAGIRVEIVRAEAPAEIRLSAPDLCALMMNIADNAISAASGAETPFVKLDIHEKAGYLAVFCENSFDPLAKGSHAKKEAVPKHGLGLKIIRSIVAKYEGVILEEAKDDRFTVEIALPLV